jgi:hypothetical protein
MTEVVKDENRVSGLLAETNDSNRTPSPLKTDPATGRLLVSGVISNQSGLLAGIAFDSITPTYASTTDTWVYKLGATTTATIVVTFVDSSKAVILSVVKS